MKHLPATCGLVILGLTACGSDGSEPEPLRWEPQTTVARALGVEVWEAKGTGERVELSGFRRVDGKEERLVHGTLEKLSDRVMVDVDQPTAWHFESKDGTSPVTSGDAPPEIGLALAGSAYELAVRTQPKSTSALSIHDSLHPQDANNDSSRSGALLNPDPTALLTSSQCLLPGVAPKVSTLLTVVATAVAVLRDLVGAPANPVDSPKPTCSLNQVQDTLRKGADDFGRAVKSSRPVQECSDQYSRQFDHCAGAFAGDGVVMARRTGDFATCLSSPDQELQQCCGSRESCMAIRERKMVEDKCKIAFPYDEARRKQCVGD